METNIEEALASDLSLLLTGRHHDPHAFLGPHEGAVRLFRPGASQMYLEVEGRIEEMRRVHPAGLFIFETKRKLSASDYRIFHASGLLAADPYACSPCIGEVDLFLFGKGCHYELYRVLGCHLKKHQGIAGAHFAVWAPNASSVYLVADCNHWDGRTLPMRSLGSSGIWELFVPGIEEGEKYKFEIRTPHGAVLLKSDPFAFYQEVRPKNGSIAFSLEGYLWGDRDWMEKRGQRGESCPVCVYELHLGSWGKTAPSYREMAAPLAEYCRQMGFTHVELLPVMEHPLDESWGYQVTGFFAATSRYGSPSDFQFLVDHLHQSGIGVILDWVGAHFPKDGHALAYFDGTALFEHADPRQGLHPHWNTAIFNYGRKEVSNFLLASALFWIEVMHVDGLRVDAVSSMLYLDYGRSEGEWIPNQEGSRYNLEAIEFLRHLNSIVQTRNPGVWMVAEESSSFAGVTHPLQNQGLGFHFKWNMGWMNDTLRYMGKDPFFRKYHQNELTFSLVYAFSEKFLLSFSHDEVVHGKGSLLSKMPGPDWQKFANLRLAYSYMMGHPGKKLLFMGGELAQWSEWNCKGSLDWPLLQFPLHAGMHKMVQDLNQLYRHSPALWENDFDWRGFSWIDFADAEQSVISYLRKGEAQTIACIHHFTPELRKNYRIRLPGAVQIREIFTSDALEYGGTGCHNSKVEIDAASFAIDLPPLATVFFEVEFAQNPGGVPGAR